MTLSEAAELELSIHLVCKLCKNRQKAQAGTLIDLHGPAISLESALERTTCASCGSTGNFSAFVFEHT